MTRPASCEHATETVMQQVLPNGRPGPEQRGWVCGWPDGPDGVAAFTKAPLWLIRSCGGGMLVTETDCAHCQAYRPRADDA